MLQNLFDDMRRRYTPSCSMHLLFQTYTSAISPALQTSVGSSQRNSKSMCARIWFSIGQCTGCNIKFLSPLLYTCQKSPVPSSGIPYIIYVCVVYLLVDLLLWSEVWLPWPPDADFGSNYDNFLWIFFSYKVIKNSQKWSLCRTLFIVELWWMWKHSASCKVSVTIHACINSTIGFYGDGALSYEVVVNYCFI